MRLGKIISIVLFALGAFFLLGAIGMLVQPSTPATTGATIVAFSFAALFIILGIIAGRKEPARAGKDLTLIAGKGLFSSWYYIGKEGIYKDKKLFLKWEEIDDIYVLNEYYESSSRLSLRTLQTGIPRTTGVTYVMGTLRVHTKDGRQIDIKNVINPKETADYIRKVYLKK